MNKEDAADATTWTPERRLKAIAKASANAQTELRAGRAHSAWAWMEVVYFLATKPSAFLEINADKFEGLE